MLRDQGEFELGSFFLACSTEEKNKEAFFFFLLSILTGASFPYNKCFLLILEE